jgi:hypothetical protein
MPDLDEPKDGWLGNDDGTITSEQAAGIDPIFRGRLRNDPVGYQRYQLESPAHETDVIIELGRLGFDGEPLKIKVNLTGEIPTILTYLALKVDDQTIVRIPFSFHDGCRALHTVCRLVGPVEDREYYTGRDPEGIDQVEL